MNYTIIASMLLLGFNLAAMDGQNNNGQQGEKADRAPQTICSPANNNGGQPGRPAEQRNQGRQYPYGCNRLPYSNLRK